MFKTGNSINACTKGIWMWRNTIKQIDKNMEILVLDTEGYGSANET